MSKSISSSFVEEEGRQESLHLQNCITPLDTWDTQKNQLNGILLQVCNWNTGGVTGSHTVSNTLHLLMIIQNEIFVKYWNNV